MKNTKHNKTNKKVTIIAKFLEIHYSDGTIDKFELGLKRGKVSIKSAAVKRETSKKLKRLEMSVDAAGRGTCPNCSQQLQVVRKEYK